MSYSPSGNIRTSVQISAVAFLLALRTGMRAGEICGLEWSDIRDDYCILNETKTVPRNVPLTKKSIRLIRKLKGNFRDEVFGISTVVLDASFRNARDRAKLSGFTFHDSRHTAATKLAQKLHVLDLCKMFGWSSTTRALTYYNPTASEIAGRLQ